MFLSILFAALAGALGAKFYLRRRLWHVPPAFARFHAPPPPWEPTVRFARAEGEGPCVSDAFRQGWSGAVAARLRLSPQQEVTVSSAFDELVAAARPLRAEVTATRRALAEALRRPAFDEVAMGELFARHDAALEAVRRAFVGTMAKVHDTLEEGQRRDLARIVERGLGSWSAFGW